MKKLSIYFMTALIFIALTSTAIRVQTTEFTYQGSLKDNAAQANGNYDFEFALFDALSGPTQLGSTLTRSAVAVTNGIFSVKLDFGAEFPGANRFLEIRVRQSGGGGFTLLTPRQPVSSAPYSVKALSSDTATSSISADNATQLSGQPASFYRNASNINGGTLDAARLPVPLTLTGTSIFHIIRADNASGSNDSSAVKGFASSPNGATFGVFGENASTSGFGVGGLATATTGTTYGGHFTSASTTNGTGVFGQGRYGVVGQSSSTSGYGVYAVAAAASGFTFGVYSQVSSPNGYGGYFVGDRNYFSGNLGIGTAGPLAKLQVNTTNETDPLNTASWDARHLVVGGLSNSGGIGLSYDQTGNVGYIIVLSPNVAYRTLVLQYGGGNLGVGVNNPAQKLDVLGNVRIGTGTNGCVEDRDGSVIAGSCSSDLRFKRNITPFAGVLNSFSKLRPVNFYWRADEFTEKHFGTKQSFGLIAQEVEQVFPELVSTDEQGYKVVNYSKLPLLTIQAVKEQQAQIEAQQKQIEALTQALCSLKPDLEVCKSNK